MRQAIATALQGDRTLDSVVPPGIPGHVTSFPVGGKATPRITWKNRITVDTDLRQHGARRRGHRDPDPDPAGEPGGLSVQLRRMHRWPTCGCSTGRRGLRPALPGCSPTSTPRCRPPRRAIQTIVTEYRRTTDGRCCAASGSLQKQAAVDNVLVPMSQSDEYLYARAGSRSATHRSGQAGSWGSTVSAMAEPSPSGVRLGPCRRGADCPDRPQGPTPLNRAQDWRTVPPAKGAVNHDDLIGRPEGVVVTSPGGTSSGHAAAAQRVHGGHAARCGSRLSRRMQR